MEKKIEDKSNFSLTENNEGFKEKIIRSSKQTIVKDDKTDLVKIRRESVNIKTPSPLKLKFPMSDFKTSTKSNIHSTRKDFKQGSIIKPTCSEVIQTFATPSARQHLSSSGTYTNHSLSHLAYLDDIDSRLRRLERSGLMKKLKAKTPNHNKIILDIEEDEVNEKPYFQRKMSASDSDISQDTIHNLKIKPKEIQGNLKSQVIKQENNHGSSVKKFSKPSSHEEPLSKKEISRLPRSKSDMDMNSDENFNDLKNYKQDKLHHAQSIPRISHSQDPKIPKVKVNNKLYCVLNLLGQGGSSEVYQVYDPLSKKTYALKVVDLSKVEEATKKSFQNEILLLQKLKDCKRVVKLIDFELVSGKNRLILVMEKGDSDLGNVLKQFIETDNSSSLDLHLIKHFWKEMLKAVDEIHRMGIIHSDLKPVNFISIGGKLKLIDFGIANSIQLDHTSVIRDYQVGTINYMPPEALRGKPEEDPSKGRSGKPFIKYNCKADVWSLGCILYNLVYGRPPFSNYPTVYAKSQAICDEKVEIKYPYHENSLVIDCIKKCLQRDPKKRATVEELLNHPFLTDSIDPSKLRLMTQLNKLTPNRINQVAKFAERLFKIERNEGH